MLDFQLHCESHEVLCEREHQLFHFHSVNSQGSSFLSIFEKQTTCEADTNNLIFEVNIFNRLKRQLQLQQKTNFWIFFILREISYES